MAILIILLIFSAVSTSVFRSSANIFDSALRNLFLSLSPLISSSNSSWTESEIVGKKSRTPSVASLSYFLLLKRPLALCWFLQTIWPGFPYPWTWRINFLLILLGYRLTCFDTFFCCLFCCERLKNAVCWSFFTLKKWFFGADFSLCALCFFLFVF